MELSILTAIRQDLNDVIDQRNVPVLEYNRDIVAREAFPETGFPVWFAFHQNGHYSADESLRKSCAFFSPDVPHSFGPVFFIPIGNLAGHRSRFGPRSLRVGKNVQIGYG
jgi:hypothetical protein